ncbi:GntR family transcriptional regulator [Sphingosinicella rhizophila]|uniref:GntR family transcriptional regulator n=1 Tax=Sphingosinicella rhizophila TaxID=3050082 RepID=A0ABU3Q8Y5_9SPHN|nr:GntR family transcriptional regulator [Sphingosinicella sp. GR2756]MDT9599873.1 GntR family transcriptional regulator [Sphingosinicella sp. GR2756]
MSPGPTFDRVYLALKEQLTSGRFAPGDHLEPAMLGPELNASITPVRDALHRLVGERIVEAPRNDGFRVPAPTEADLRDLYGWNRSLLELALRSSAFRSPVSALRAAEIGGEDTLISAADLFRAIARRTGSLELEAAVENLNDRLAPLRVAETRIFEDAAEEHRIQRNAWEQGDDRELRRCIVVYHRRRQRHAPDILIAFRTLHRRR